MVALQPLMVTGLFILDRSGHKMTVNFDPIFSGMQNGPEKIKGNFDKVKTELERMNGNVVTIPKEQFTKLNGVVSMNPNTCECTIFKFNDFAIMQINAYVGLTMKGWTDSAVVAVPKSYFNDYSKFKLLGNHDRMTDENLHYNTDFHLDTGTVSINTRGAEWNNKGASINISGILHN